MAKNEDFFYELQIIIIKRQTEYLLLFIRNNDDTYICPRKL